MNRFIEAVSIMWRRLSSREQRLALGVLAVAILTIVVTSSRVALDRLANLEGTIVQLENELVQYRQQMARQQSVEAQYREVAAQHSSEWTEAEIHDRLRQEIYRLAQKVPPALDERGIPAQVSSDMGNLIEIPSLQQGRLEESGDGYREYSLSFRIPTAELFDLFDFIERLQGSPQSLRIDGFDMNRGSAGTTVNANFRITRTIVSGSPEQFRDAAPAPTVSDGLPLIASEWLGEGALLLEEGSALVATSYDDGPGSVYTVRSLPGGYTYDMFVEATCEGGADLAIAFDGNGETFSGHAALNGDGQAYRYHIQFALPGGATDRVRLRAPFIRLHEPEAKVTLTRLTLQRAG